MDQRFSHHEFGQSEPLPAEFLGPLRTLDARLARQARQTPVPHGLADRVFAASAPLLNRPQAVPAERPRLRLVPAGERFSRLVWSRLAMAASVAIVCGAAAWFLRSSHSQNPSLVVDAAQQARHADLLAALASDSSATAQLENQFAYLLETNSLTPEDLSHEMFMLAGR